MMPPWMSTIVASAASVLIAILSSNWFSRRMMRREHTNEILSRLDKIEEDTAQIKDLRDADVALLEDRYKHLCRAAIRAKHISTEQLEAIHKLSEFYFKFDDSDGSGHALLRLVEQLPIQEEN